MVASAASVPSDRLERDLVQLREGIRLLFVNEFRAAEEIFKRGAQQEPACADPGADGSVPRDIRGAFSLIWALTSLMFGLLSFESKQLDDCLEHVRTTEKLVLEDTPWAGQRMLLGIVYLIGGMVEAAKNTWLRAGVNFVRALRFIREFEDGLSFEGPEEPLVRSMARFFLGLFNFVISMLPPRLLKVASRAGGGALKGSRLDALSLLTSCLEEEGIMAPFAVIVLVCYSVTLKTYLGEDSNDEDVLCSRRLLAWAEARYPGSAIFGFFETEFQASQRRILDASECAFRVHKVLGHLQLPAVNAFLEQKKACLSIAVLDWRAASEGCERSLAISTSMKRRSYVPFYSYVAGLCRLLDGDAEAFRANFDRIARYAKIRKRNWPPEDDLAFHKAREYMQVHSFGTYRALLDIVEVSMLKVHLLHTMPPDMVHRLVALLEDASWSDQAVQDCRQPGGSGSAGGTFLAPEETARSFLFRAELMRLLGDKEEAKRLAMLGVELVPKLGARGAANGTARTLHLTLALLGVEGHLEALDRCPKPCKVFDDALKFKRLGLKETSKVREAFRRRAKDNDDDKTSNTVPSNSDDADMYEETEFFSASAHEDESLATPRATPRASPGALRERLLENRRSYPFLVPPVETRGAADAGGPAAAAAGEKMLQIGAVAAEGYHGDDELPAPRIETFASACSHMSAPSPRARLRTLGEAFANMRSYWSNTATGGHSAREGHWREAISAVRSYLPSAHPGSGDEEREGHLRAAVPPAGGASAAALPPAETSGCCMFRT